MLKIFISYQRDSTTKVINLVSDIKLLGHEVWYDKDLSGGQNWWNTILDSIQKCDIFLFIITAKSLESPACKNEYKYAESLLKPIVPILEDAKGVSINLLPQELSKVQYIDYQNQSRETAFYLSKSLSQFSPKPLPTPLPEPPKAPLSYLGTLSKKITTETQLNAEDQNSLMVDIKSSLSVSDTSDSEIILILNKFRERKDLLASISNEIDDLLLLIDTKNTIENNSFISKRSVYLSFSAITLYDHFRYHIEKLWLILSIFFFIFFLLNADFDYKLTKDLFLNAMGSLLFSLILLDIIVITLSIFISLYINNYSDEDEKKIILNLVANYNWKCV